MNEDELKSKLAKAEEINRINELLDEERAKSDRLYAIKLAEVAIFSLIGLLSLAVVGALISLVIKK